MNLTELIEKSLTDHEVRKAYETHDIALEASHYVIRLRLRHTMTQEQFGRKLGMSQAALSRLESGNHLPSLKTLDKIANAFGEKLHLYSLENTTPTNTFHFL